MRVVKDDILHLRVVTKSSLKIPKRKVIMAYSSGNLLPEQILKHLLWLRMTLY
jgi:hypothetical protein